MESGVKVSTFIESFFEVGALAGSVLWPPDVFAVTSALLKKTGAYRYAISKRFNDYRHTVSQKGEIHYPWQGHVENHADSWIKYVNSELAGSGRDKPEEVKRIGKLIEFVSTTSGNVSMEELRILKKDSCLALCDALLELHACADEACLGMGLPGIRDRERALIHCLANLLLTSTGSLSSFPKSCGIVTPKMRTPQSGITVRSLSHHLNFQETEVEVIWRTMPWENVAENTLNVLVIPHPTSVDHTDFTGKRESFESVQYFNYLKGTDPFAPEKKDYRDSLNKLLSEIVTLVCTASRDATRVHVVVLPEAALTWHEYKLLLNRLVELHKDGELKYIPMMVVGTRGGRPKGALAPEDQEQPGDASAEPKTSDEVVQGELNQVKLAVYFAGRWYEISQRKHHRWKLNREQIRQYGLDGTLSTTREWFENISIAQRRLSFLAPTSWLALCPLICEDLAQLEPVSEVVRGVGPTLMFALLFDGPQLTSRWPARYASVLADDPGTGVLSLTSKGMAKRSRRTGSQRAEDGQFVTVALWRDQVTGWQSLDLKENEDAVLLTLTAESREESTADSRSDHQNSAAIRYGGVKFYSLEDLPKGAQNYVKLNMSRGQLESEMADELTFATWTDLRELSAFFYVLNAWISLKGEHSNKMFDWLRSGSDEPGVQEKLAKIVRIVKATQLDPAAAGISVGVTKNTRHKNMKRRSWQTESLEQAVRLLEDWEQMPAEVKNGIALHPLEATKCRVDFLVEGEVGVMMVANE